MKTIVKVVQDDNYPNQQYVTITDEHLGIKDMHIDDVMDGFLYTRRELEKRNTLIDELICEKNSALGMLDVERQRYGSDIPDDHWSVTAKEEDGSEWVQLAEASQRLHDLETVIGNKNRLIDGLIEKIAHIRDSLGELEDFILDARHEYSQVSDDMDNLIWDQYDRALETITRIAGVMNS